MKNMDIASYGIAAEYLVKAGTEGFIIILLKAKDFRLTSNIYSLMISR